MRDLSRRIKLILKGDWEKLAKLKRERLVANQTKFRYNVKHLDGLKRKGWPF